MKIKKEELKAILLASFILGIIFGFDDKKEVFVLSSWTYNFVFQILQSALFILVFVAITKHFAIKRGVNVEFRIWQNKVPVLRTTPFGIIFPLLITLVSYGKLFFPAVLMPSFTHIRTKRLGKKFEMPSEFEIARISSAAPLILTVLVVFLYSIKESLPINTLTIPLALSIVYLLPLPMLNGIHIFFSSLTYYVFSIVFIVLSYILMTVLSPISTVILAFILSIILAVTFNVQEYIYK